MGPAITSCGPPVTKPTQAVTADWQNGTISFVDYAALSAGGEPEKQVLDVSSYLPGPLEIEVTPDRKTALATVSTGFFRIPGAGLLVGGDGPPPSPTGKLLFIDLPSKQVVATLDTGEDPQGIAITPDGKRAFIPHFTSGTMAVVDIQARTVLDTVEIGVFAEEIAFDSTATVGVFSYGITGEVRTFAVNDLRGTLSPPVDLSGDSAGVAFFPGTKVAYIVQAYNFFLQLPGGYSLVDVTNPSAPVVLQDKRPNDAIEYAAAAVPERNSIVVSGGQAGKATLREYKLGANNDIELQQALTLMDIQFFGPFAMTSDGFGNVLSALPKERSVAVSNLATGESVIVPWTVKAGPTDIAVY
jgi:hypothetical protein